MPRSFRGKCQYAFLLLRSFGRVVLFAELINAADQSGGCIRDQLVIEIVFRVMNHWLIRPLALPEKNVGAGAMFEHESKIF